MANRNKKVADKYTAAKDEAESFNDKRNSRGKKSGRPSADKGSHRNDISWYVTDPQILLDVARIPYPIPVGYPMTRRGLATPGLVPSGYDDAIPGIAAMGIIPTIGNAQYANDAVNVAANGMYTFVRHLNSGSRNYDANDMIIYCMAVNCIYYMISWCTRLYATLTLYAQGNRYLPDALIRAQRVSASDLRAHMAQFRAGLNQRIRKISTLVVPGVLPIFARHSWLFSNYFIEGESIKDQVYLFFPYAWYKFMKDDDGAGMLKCFTMKGNAAGGILYADDLLKILDEMIDPIFAEEDFNIISGDLLKAYGESNILKLGLVPDELPIGISFSEEVLLQFKNAKINAVNEKSYSGDHEMEKTEFYDSMFDVVQSSDKGYVEVLRSLDAISYIQDFKGTGYNSYSTPGSKLLIQAHFNEFSKDILLTSPHADVKPEENMINTRLTLAYDVQYDDDPDSTTGVIIPDMYFGSDWPCGVNYYVYHRSKATGENSLLGRTMYRTMLVTSTDSESVDACIHSYLPIRSAFKYAPELSIIERQIIPSEDPEEDPTIQILESGRSIFEVDNYTLVKSNVISMLHNAAIQGEYNIPKIALFPTK